MQGIEKFNDIVVKIIRGEKVNRIDEENLFYFLAKFYGERNVLTEIVINENGVEYFGCAVRDCGKWRVYNLAGTGEGVVVKMENRARLAVKVG